FKIYTCLEANRLPKRYFSDHLQRDCICVQLHGDPYEKFLRQHVDNSVKNGNYEYCAKMMKKRKMTRPVCKPLNTFIHANKNDVVAVCLENSPIQNGTRIRTNRPPCKYKADNTNGSLKLHVIIIRNITFLYFDISFFLIAYSYISLKQ
uniref:Ribonuclease A-domain domain-containing protein n=1 Tax=Erpetoichthys calabaricus TaxID=27687 RepID=A0A8C4RSN0_ERPCA